MSVVSGLTVILGNCDVSVGRKLSFGLKKCWF